MMMFVIANLGSLHFYQSEARPFCNHKYLGVVMVICVRS